MIDGGTDLKAWRDGNGVSLTAVANACGVNVTTAMRWESGAQLPDADMVQRIVDFTGGAVTVVALHRARLEWLRENRPDKFLHTEAAE